MRDIKSTILIAGMTALLSVTTQASPIVFDLTTPVTPVAVNDQLDEIDYSAGGVDLTVSAVKTISGFVVQSELEQTDVVFLGSDGLGESNGVPGDSVYVDGFGAYNTGDYVSFDYLSFQFSEDVLLESFSMGYVGLDSDAHVFRYQDGAYVRQFPILSGNTGENTVFDPYTVPAVASDLWLIGAFSPRHNIYGDIDPESFSIDSVTVSAVPIPAAWLLFGTGFMYLGWLRRRKS